MKYVKFPIIPLLLAFIFGILYEHFTNSNLKGLSISIIIAALSCFILYLYSKKEKNNPISLGISILISFFILGAINKNLHSDLNSKNHFSNYLKDENNIIVGFVNEKLKSTSFYDKYILDVSQINKQFAKGKILIYLPKTRISKLTIGTEIRLFSEIKYIDPITNPYQFNYTQYLNNQNIYYDIHYKKEDKIAITNCKNWKFYINQLKEKLISSFTYLHLKEDNYNLLMALLFGERTTLSKELTDNYTNTGVVHILAISGLHIALFYGLILWCSNPLKKYRNGKLYLFLLSISTLWIYALLTGMSASVVRAVVMFTIIAYGTLVNKQVNIYNSLATSALLLLLWNPNYLFDIGFQLRYCAVIAIIAFQPVVNKYSYSKKWLVLKTKETLLITLVAQLGVLPLTLYYFGQFPILFLISNVIVIPLSSLILILGLAIIPLNLILPSIGQYVGIIIEYLIDKMNQFTFWIGQFDSFIIKNIAFHELLVVFLFGIIWSLLNYFSNPKIKKVTWVLISILSFQIAYLAIFLNKNEHSELLVFNSYKNSILVLKRNKEATFYSTDFKKNKQLITNYCRNNFIVNKKEIPLKNSIYFQERILCIDSNGIYKTRMSPKIILLTQSPKINLERLIQIHQPKQIIADGSNYKSYIKLWKATCEKQKIPFHATTEKGLIQIK